MSVTIQFDKPNALHFTNLDVVSGRVILALQADATISAINVKLEGESRTRLAGPKASSNDRSDKKRTELEVHKLLYKVVTVFPSPEVQKQSTSSSSYTLLAGQYEYPFSFKFPFNNACSSSSSLLRDLKVGALSVQFAPDTNKHVKRALPPSLSGFPGEAEIKYYVKATVVRPKFYQENLRSLIDIKFLPIEPPRPPDRNQETFARRKQKFNKSYAQPQKKGMFRKTSVPDPATNEEPPAFQVDARLPNPAIITCNEPLPLRILVQKLSESSATMYLGMLQIELIGYTHVKAHDLNRSESGSCVLTSQSNLDMPLGQALDPAYKEWKIPSRLWDKIPLPSTVAPSFDTCNLSRTYELEVRVGLAHGTPGATKPELIVLPLRLPVKVYSGIAPPAALLRAIASPRPQGYMTNPMQPSSPSPQGLSYPPTPTTPTTPSYSQPPARTGTFGAPQQQLPENDAPPSYEDAMAEEIGPVDGPRRQYDFSNEPEQRTGAFNDEVKGLGITRRPSERLFPQNNTDGHSRGSSFGASSFGNGQIPLSPVDADEDISGNPTRSRRG